MNQRTFAYFRFACILISFLIILLLTSRYFSPNGDYANSSLVWRMFNEHGYSAFFDWKPTADSWYFTVYPLHFLLFYVTGSDGVIPLILATAIFTLVLALSTSSIIMRATSSKFCWFISLLAITFLPEIMYLGGFISHPFAHNSTNAFGMCILGLMAWNLEKRKLLVTIFSGITLLFVNASDMWVAPTYFLPILICEIYFSIKYKSNYSHPAILTIFFILSLTHVISKLMGIEVQGFSIVPFDKIIENIFITITLIGETVNLFFVSSSFSFTLSFIIFAVLSTYAFIISFMMGGYSRYIGLAAYLSLLGIVSSFILSNLSLPPGPPRFFINILPFVVILLSIASSKKGLVYKAFISVLILLILNSLTSYTKINKKVNSDILATNDYINFLKKNNLSYGYGDFWKMTQTVNLLSEGDITAIPIFMRKNERFDDREVRMQTFRSWYTEEFRAKAPERQFISIAKGHQCSDVDTCVRNAQIQVGIADEVLHWRNYTILVYNKKIKF